MGDMLNKLQTGAVVTVTQKRVIALLQSGGHLHKSGNCSTHLMYNGSGKYVGGVRRGTLDAMRKAGLLDGVGLPKPRRERRSDDEKYMDDTDRILRGERPLHHKPCAIHGCEFCDR